MLIRPVLPRPPPRGAPVTPHASSHATRIDSVRAPASNVSAYSFSAAVAGPTTARPLASYCEPWKKQLMRPFA